MNARKAKSIRRAISANGLHPRDVKLIPTKPVTFWASGVPGVGPSAVFAGQRMLANCGRKAYRALKSAIRRGEVTA